MGSYEKSGTSSYPELPKGTRVKVHPLPELKFQGDDTGTIASKIIDKLYYRVRLNKKARWYTGPNTYTELRLVRVAVEDFKVLPPIKSLTSKP